MDLVEREGFDDGSRRASIMSWTSAQIAKEEAGKILTVEVSVVIYLGPSLDLISAASPPPPLPLFPALKRPPHRPQRPPEPIHVVHNRPTGPQHRTQHPPPPPPPLLLLTAPTVHREQHNGYARPHQRCKSLSCVHHSPYPQPPAPTDQPISHFQSRHHPPHPLTPRTPILISNRRQSISWPPTAIDDPHKIVKVIASEGKSGETRDLTYTNCKVVGNGSFGVVFQAKLVGSPKDGDDIAIKKVLQDKRFKVRAPDLQPYIPHLIHLDRTANCK